MDPPSSISAPELTGAILLADETSAKHFYQLADKYYRGTFERAHQPSNLGKLLIRLGELDVIVLDRPMLTGSQSHESFKELTDQQGPVFVYIDPRPPLMLDAEGLNLIHLPQMPATVEKDKYVELIGRAAEERGYSTATGKTDSRIVQRETLSDFDIIIEPPEGEGIKTVHLTGFNENGLGARIGLPEEAMIRPGDECTITIDAKSYEFMPTEGEVLSVQESRDGQYDAFVTLQFLEGGFGVDPMDRQVIQDWIERQDEQSVRKRPLE